MYYKLIILSFFLTAFNSQSLINNYKIIFENENATYTLKIDNSSLVFENGQPNVTVTADGNNSSNVDKASNTSRNTYQITKGSTWQNGLKIGETDGLFGQKEMKSSIFSVDDHHVYEIKLSYEFVMILEKSSNIKHLFPIGDNGLFAHIEGTKFSLHK